MSKLWENRKKTVGVKYTSENNSFNICPKCYQKYKSYEKEHHNWEESRKEIEGISIKFGAFLILVGEIALIIYHINIKSMDNFWGRFLFGPLLIEAINIIIFAVVKLIHKLGEPKNPNSRPNKDYIYECNANT